MKARGAVASSHHAATAVGREVLASGGNALDAAIAVGAMLAVVYPHMCGVGGDAFLLYYEARSGKVHCLNGTGPAPGLATRDAFAERGVEAVPVRGPLSVTVPGVVAAWDVALKRLGTRSLGDLLGPAIDAAQTGVEVGARLATWIREAGQQLDSDPTLSRRFLDVTGQPLLAGDRLRQPELATTLRRIAYAGARDFYRGEIAEELDRAMRDAGGLLRKADLRAYAPRWVAPIRTRHDGVDVLTTPPNSQGITALLMLKHLAAHRAESGSGADYVRALIAAKRAAFAIRDRYVTDPEHMPVSAAQLLRGGFRQPAQAVAAPPLGGDTAYFCTTDSDGNVCSAIESIFYPFGSAFVAGDTGVLLHNRGHYFSLTPDQANRLEPGKRTLHTLMVCLALDRGRPRFAFGTMGADGQPQINVQVLHQLSGGADPQAAVSAPRVLHGRFLVEDDPSVLHVEADFDPETLGSLHATLPMIKVVPARDERLGHAHALTIHLDGTISSGSDPRSDGSAEVIV